MKPRVFAFSLFVAFFLGLSVSRADELADRIRRVENGLTASDKSADKQSIAKRMAALNVPGVRVAVIEDGRIVWARGYGVCEAGADKAVTPDTLFQAASISKPVAAFAALRLVDQGKFDLNRNVNDDLKSWKVPESEFTRSRRVTLAGLLSHSAGLTVHGFRGYADGQPRPTLLQILDGTAPANSPAIRVDLAPGSRFRYSGGGYCVLQCLLVDTTGVGFAEFLRDTVLSKLEMRHSTYEQPLPNARRAEAASGHNGRGNVVPGGRHVYPEMAAAGLWTTPSDLARFAIEVRSARAGKSQWLSVKSATAMTTPAAGNWGLGLEVRKVGPSTYFSHGGANEGFRCILTMCLETGLGAVIMTNGDNGIALARELQRSIQSEYRWP